MTHRTKAFGLSFVAIAAMSMVVAAGVQASQVHVTTKNNTVVTGTVEQPHKVHQFLTVFGATQCTQTQFEGTITGAGGQATQTTTKEISLTATYTGCTAFGQASTVDLNGCKFTITGTSTQGATTAGTAYVDITGCTPGKQIEITTGICTVTVPEQHNLSHILLTNKGTAPLHDITADITVSGITYEGHGALCPNGKGHTTLFHDGTYTGEATFRAFEGDNSVQVEHNKHKYQKLLHNGNQVGILAT